MTIGNPEETVEYWRSRALAAERRWDLYFGTQEKEKKEKANRQKMLEMVAWVNECDFLSPERVRRIGAALVWWNKTDRSLLTNEFAHGLGLLLRDFERLALDIHHGNKDASFYACAENDLRELEKRGES
jgi:hypothetical protein